MQTLQPSKGATLPLVTGHGALGENSVAQYSIRSAAMTLVCFGVSG